MKKVKEKEKKKERRKGKKKRKKGRRRKEKGQIRLRSNNFHSDPTGGYGGQSPPNVF